MAEVPIWCNLISNRTVSVLIGKKNIWKMQNVSFNTSVLVKSFGKHWLGKTMISPASGTQWLFTELTCKVQSFSWSECQVCLDADEMSQDLGRYHWSSFRCKMLEIQNLPLVDIFCSNFQAESDSYSASTNLSQSHVFCNASVLQDDLKSLIDSVQARVKPWNSFICHNC